MAAVTLLVFSPTLRNGFVSWDDDKNFLTNYHYRGLGTPQLGWMWSTFHLGHYVPLSWMTLGGDYLLWGMDPAGYHFTNIALHATSAVLLYLLALRLLRATTPPHARDGAAALPLGAAFCALLFSLHPLRVESVAWITERRDVLSLAFYLGSALLYLRSLDTGRRCSRAYWASLALFACALLSKATALSLPVVLLVFNIYPLRRLDIRGTGWRSEDASRVYSELAPFALLSALSVISTLVALQHLTQLDLAGKVAVSSYSVMFYVWKTIAPVSLAALYSMPRSVDPLGARYVLGYVVVLGMSAFAWIARTRMPIATVAWIIFLVCVFPMLGLVQNGPQIAADRYTYFAAPFVGLALAAWLMGLHRRSGVAAPAFGIVILLTFGALTWNQIGTWRTSTTLWSRVLEVEPGSPIGANNMGNLLYQSGKFDDAMHYYRAAIAASPDYHEAYNNLGVALSRKGQYDEAIAEYQHAIAVFPAYDEAHDNWGVALAALHRPAEAIAQYQQAVALNPENSDAQVNWGNARLLLGDIPGAISQYEYALRIQPDNADAYVNWGVALAREGKLAEAVEEFRHAVAIRADHPEANTYLQRALAILQAAPTNRSR